MASKLNDSVPVLDDDPPSDDPAGSSSNDEERPDETEACYESDEFHVLESQLVMAEQTDAVAPAATAHEGFSALSPPNTPDSWSARTSFTADSPYFDAFVDSETQSLGVLSETLNGIAARTRTFVKQGAIMCEATRRLGLACKLRSSDYSSSDDDAVASSDDGVVTEEELTQQRRNAVGEEMAGILELLGEVR